MTDILKKLRDLHKQATKERSHYYVGATVLEAIEEIERLHREIGWQRGLKIAAEKRVEPLPDMEFLLWLEKYVPTQYAMFRSRFEEQRPKSHNERR